MSLDHDDYATLARIEDHLRRIADALERPRADRLSELVDIAQRGLDRVAASLRLDRGPDDTRLAMQDLAMELRAALDTKPCDDRTCTDCDHWAPVGRVNHGDTPTTCIYGQDHLDDLECEYACPATMPGHWCTRREHSDDRHVWAMSDEEAQRILRAGQELGFVAEADPLDENDHRPRHDRDGDHWKRWPDGWGQTAGWFTLAKVGSTYGPLTFCDCDTTREADLLPCSGCEAAKGQCAASMRAGYRGCCPDCRHGDQSPYEALSASQDGSGADQGQTDPDDATIQAENGATD